MASPAVAPWPPSSPGRPATDLRAVRWATMAFLVVDSTDVVVGLLAPNSVVARPAIVDVVQTALGLAACALVMWRRWPSAAVTTAALVVLMLVRHPVGIEANLLIVGAAALAISLPPRAVAGSLAASVAYAFALGFAVHLDRGSDLLSASLVSVSAVVVATLAGVLARRLLHEREEARRSLHRVHAENLRIRAAERRALAEELQGILTRDFATMLAAIDEAADSRDPVLVQRTIARVGALSRSTLAAVRLTLRTLREELAPVAAHPGERPPAMIDALRSPRCRQLLSAVCVLASLLAAIGVAGRADGLSGALVGEAAVVLGPLAAALALSRLRLGVAMAAGALVLALMASEPSLWVAIPTAVLCFAAGRDGRWPWLVAAVALVLAHVVVQATLHGREAGLLIGVLEVVAIGSALLGLTVGHFETVRNRTRGALDHLQTQQTGIAAEERANVARELHDVVGYQLSVTSLQALAAERETDPDVLHGLVVRIRQALTTGRSEIDGLVEALKSAVGEEGEVSEVRARCSRCSSPRRSQAT